MTINGKPYKAKGEAARKVNAAKARAVYFVYGHPTIEQQVAIDQMEKHLQEDWQGIANPYSAMRKVESMGIEFHEEYQTPDGRWVLPEDPDAALTNMTTGAL